MNMKTCEYADTPRDNRTNPILVENRYMLYTKLCTYVQSIYSRREREMQKVVKVYTVKKGDNSAIS